MTTLYCPVLISSAEQAEALPLGTVAIDRDSQGQPYQASIRVRGGWYCTGEVAADGSPWLAPHDVMTGDTALVPIEAEEEQGMLDLPEMLGGGRDVPVSRLVTPWEQQQ